MTDSVTISLLPVSLSIVHVPRSRIHDLFHPLLRQLLLPNPAFLSLTCNELELSLFAEHHILRDFEPIAEKDARKLLTRDRDRAAKPRSKTPCEPVQFSAERWNVLQIDSHSDEHENSGARIHELSAPLAAAGISILYQSSYMSDFIFVKEPELHEVMSLLASAGFDLYSSDHANLSYQVSAFASPVLSPIMDVSDDTSSLHLLDLGPPSTMHAVSSESGAVLTRSRASTDSTSPQSSKSGKPLVSTRSTSHSPSGCDVRILEPDLTSIGLSDDTADMWTTKIIKLLAFPDMIPLPSSSSGGQRRARSRRSPLGQHRSTVDSNLPSSPLDELDSMAGLLGVPGTPDIDSDSSGSLTDDTTRETLFTPRDSAAQSPSEVFLDLEEAEERKPWQDDTCSTEEVDSVSDDDSSSAPDSGVDDVPDELPDLSPIDTDTPTEEKSVFVAPTSTTHSRSASSSSSSADPIVPFFSFTRTREGSSLTASVPLLAALFPPSERHMVSCCDELDVLDSRAVSPERASGSDAAEEEKEDGEKELCGTLKCLQIDLRKFGLDKHGLVCRFSRTLDDNGIGHAYSSTYKTANLLVDKANAWRAQALLRSC
ncbi:hypothetical protein EUX98_g3502 [Antrodiella citrinella]|uniref:CASTOR ACT domain-containing protein n=1 Tax=Antrodiella citrinella TaxID=2447956 RepID=A0A4S4MYX2_9APHY|nr:hypothetical protein EUX98_g3502 [Antrodiella citrinella]